MKVFSRFLCALSLLFVSLVTSAAPIRLDGLYVNSFGDSKNPSLIFVHGGPGYNSQDFEFSTAQTLADQGYFVVVYDQRGQGRSDLAQSVQDYTYQKYSNDLLSIIHHYNLKKPVLLGHSHGGPISLKFDQMNPGVVSKIVLISAPINFWKSMESIQANCTKRYQKSGDSEDFTKLQKVFATLKSTAIKVEEKIEAVGTAFELGAAPACGLYSPASRTSEAKALKEIVAKNLIPAEKENLFFPMPNFLINENYIRLDHSSWVRENAGHIFGIYGDEDGLFTPGIFKEMKALLLANKSPYRFQVLKGASHGLYIDQQRDFILALKKVLNGR